MHIFELADQIKSKPEMFLDGDKSIKRLRSFFVGYELGASSDQGRFTGQDDMRKFNSWVAKQLGFTESTSGWCNMILSTAGSDKKGYNLFFELLDKYRGQTEPSL